MTETTDNTAGGLDAPGTSGAGARDRLIQAAIDEFSRRGFQGARVDVIASQAQANKQLVYHYFGSKAGLYDAALETAFNAVSPAAEEMAFPGMPAEMALRLYLELLSKTIFSNMAVQRLLFDENMQRGEHVRQISSVKDGTTRRVEALAEIMRQGVRERVFRDGLDPRQLYISVSAVFSLRATNSHTMTYNLGVDLISPAGAERSRQWAIDFVVNAVRAPVQSG